MIRKDNLEMQIKGSLMSKSNNNNQFSLKKLGKRIRVGLKRKTPIA